MDIVIKEALIGDAIEVHKKIPEFSDSPPQKYLDAQRFEGKKTLFLIAFIGNKPVGYMAAYDRFDDKSFYCWMTGVVPAYRNYGVLSAMMTYLFKWASLNKFSKIKLKSRQERREMNAFLIKRGFSFTSIEQHSDIKENRVCFERDIDEDFDFEAKV